jgi:hypothetical protein
MSIGSMEGGGKRTKTKLVLAIGGPKYHRSIAQLAPKFVAAQSTCVCVFMVVSNAFLPLIFLVASFFPRLSPCLD